MGALLKDFLGFTAGDITALTDAKAGRYSYLVFSLPNRGPQMPDTSGDEPDRADEAFCPHDLVQKGNVWDSSRIIVDDDLHDLFVQLPANVLLEVYLDSCHSGTGLKAVDMLLDPKPRYMPPPSLGDFMKVDGRRSADFTRVLWRKTSSTTSYGPPAALTKPAPMPPSAAPGTAPSPTFSSRRCGPLQNDEKTHLFDQSGPAEV